MTEEIMSTFTVEMNEKIKELFEHYSLTEDETCFYNYTMYNDLQEGDYILFPFNVRSGIYRIKKSTLGPLAPKGYEKEKFSMVTRNSIGAHLIPTHLNKGIWIMKVDPQYVDWSFWEGVDSMIHFNIFDFSLNIDEVEGYSNWYDFEEWRKILPHEIFPSEPIRKIIR